MHLLDRYPSTDYPNFKNSISLVFVLAIGIGIDSSLTNIWIKTKTLSDNKKFVIPLIILK